MDSTGRLDVTKVESALGLYPFRGWLEVLMEGGRGVTIELMGVACGTNVVTIAYLR